MRLGGNIELPYDSPEQWLGHVRELEYSTVLAPVDESASPEEKKAYLEMIEKHGLTIGEVGVWKNTLDPDDGTRKEAVRYACERLALAEELGADCCVNIAGARGSIWDGYYPDNYSPDTYALLVDTVREIIDTVKPKRTYYTLESMPWMLPDSPDSYLGLVRDIDRTAFGVHLDYANMINGFEKYHSHASFIRECFKKLGPYIKSVHAKDIKMGSTMPCSIGEVLPGQGIIDFSLVLRLTARLGADMPLFVEHLDSHGAYRSASRYIRQCAGDAGIDIK